MIPVDFSIGEEAGKLYWPLREKRQKFSLSDTISLAAAKRLIGKVLTFDTDFAGLTDAVVLS
ncbi:PIN domain-containing protein [Candidatus Woesearchaeota archaeon]|nr:PIN domain-containing protein [Candidatus Woesearchaeota archaeon]